MAKIVPKSLCKADFCALDKYYYIIRPDLTCYMRSTNFITGEDLEVFSLHPSCRNGDHYLASDDDKNFYIIYSTHYRRVSNLTTDESAVVYPLHPGCRRGDYYFAASGYFYIVFQKCGSYCKTKTLYKYEERESFSQHPKCNDGIYYFGRKNYYYFVNPGEQLEIQYTRCTNFDTNEGAETFSFHPNVYGFLPGGAAIVKGPSYFDWVSIKSFRNDSQTPVEWTKKFTMKVGYEKETISSLESSWKVAPSVSAETGGLSAMIVKAQFSLSHEFGGINNSSEMRNWNEVTEIEETIILTLQPNQNIHIYVPQIFLGEEPVLHCQDMKMFELEDKWYPCER